VADDDGGAPNWIRLFAAPVLVALLTSAVGGYLSSTYGARETIVRLEERFEALSSRVDRQDETIGKLATKDDVDAVRADIAEVRRLLLGFAR